MSSELVIVLILVPRPSLYELLHYRLFLKNILNLMRSHCFHFYTALNLFKLLYIYKNYQFKFNKRQHKKSYIGYRSVYL